jgi:hypothetical protein
MYTVLYQTWFPPFVVKLLTSFYHNLAKKMARLVRAFVLLSRTSYPKIRKITNASSAAAMSQPGRICVQGLYPHFYSLLRSASVACNGYLANHGTTVVRVRCSSQQERKRRGPSRTRVASPIQSRTCHFSTPRRENWFGEVAPPPSDWRQKYTATYLARRAPAPGARASPLVPAALEGPASCLGRSPKVIL